MSRLARPTNITNVNGSSPFARPILLGGGFIWRHLNPPHRILVKTHVQMTLLRSISALILLGE